MLLLVLLKCLVFILIFPPISSYKILGLFHHPGKSHMDVYLPLMKSLADKGHEVTVISHFPLQESHNNYKDIRLTNLEVHVNNRRVDDFKGNRYEKYASVWRLNRIGKESCRAGFQSESLQNFMKENHQFDVVIIEFFNTDCFLGIANKFKAPIIGLSSCTIMSWTNSRYGNPVNPAYVPVNLLDFSDRMSFIERVENTMMYALSQFYHNYVVIPTDELYIKQYLDNNTVDLKSIINNVSLLLVNTHFSLNLPRPLVPGVVEIGGIHIGKLKPLPNDLEKWINESSHGVIYFSFGSMIKGHTFPEEKRLAFLKAFERLPQRILWKWEDDTMPNQPANIRLIKWAPQLDILCHPNVVGFISHGGLLGTTEAVHCGVPVVVMPQFGDQHINARALEANGGGVILHLKEANEDKIYNAIQTILDPKFRKGAQKLSERFKDRPLPPLETAIYWVEYVARHRGAHHMRTAAVDMPFYQYYLLDVLLFLTIVTLSILTIMFYLSRTIIRKLFIKDNSKIKTN